MRDILINAILQDMLGSLSNEQLVHLKKVLSSRLTDDLFKSNLNTLRSSDNDEDFIQRFLSAKKVEGCSYKTIHYYESTLKRLYQHVGKPVRQISTNDLREYLENYQLERCISRTTLDNVRRILSSFFGWMEDEDLIIKSPVRRIHKVKTEKQIKEIYSD